MERLTFDNSKGNGILLASVTEKCGKDQGLTCDTMCRDHSMKNKNNCKSCPIQAAFDLLAQYERTFLTPADITAMQAENKRLTERIGFLEAACEANGATAELAVKRYGEFVDRMKGEIAELAAFKGQIERGEMVRVPCKAGDTVYVIASCEDVYMHRDDDYENGTGEVTCPFEGSCEYEDCDDANRRVFETLVRSIWIAEDGPDCAEIMVEDLTGGYKVKDIGKTIFLTEESARAALKP